MIPLIFAIHTTHASAATTTAELFEAPHTLEGTLDRPSFPVSGQPRDLWTVRTTSDGQHAWGVATIVGPPGVYVPPGTPGYQVDHKSDGSLILWRWVSVAVEYDHAAKTARRCETRSMHVLSADGTDRAGTPTREHVIGPLEANLLVHWLWGALGDASMEMSRHQDAQHDPVAGIPLFRSAEWTLGEATYRAALTSFVPTFDPAVKEAALALLRECKGDPEPEDF